MEKLFVFPLWGQHLTWYISFILSYSLKNIIPVILLFFIISFSFLPDHSPKPTISLNSNNRNLSFDDCLFGYCCNSQILILLQQSLSISAVSGSFSPMFSQSISNKYFNTTPQNCFCKCHH